MNSQQHMAELERLSRKRIESLELAKNTVLLLLAVVAFLIYYLLGKLQEAMSILSL